MSTPTAIIIGAGPAGLTVAYELLDKTAIHPVIFEASGDIGGISKTVNYKGNRMDIGGHRFFSKSDRVMEWWKNILPLQGAPAKDDLVLGRDSVLETTARHRSIGSSHWKTTPAPDPEDSDNVMLIRKRLSRILFLRRFFDYPISPNLATFRNLGSLRVARILASYAKARIFPTKGEQSLQDFLINRFGKELYLTFFKDYTEKVWGVPCNEIPAEWGAQRIKGLSITSALKHAFKKLFSSASLDQKSTETTLIEQFAYPKLGPGQLWEEVARQVQTAGAEIHFYSQIVGIKTCNSRVTSALVKNHKTGVISHVSGEWFFSSMPVKDLILGLNPSPGEQVLKVAQGLQYRDFFTVGILARNLKPKNLTRIPTLHGSIPDNWIYVQEPDVHLGRIQVFNNWSPYLVADPNKVWLGLEYFCHEGDALWSQSDESLAALAAEELVKIGFLDKKDILDHIVVRMPKTYPAYFGTYKDFTIIRDYIDILENLFLIGRNGMHRYNNADHSMLTAMTAVENIINGVRTKDNIWAVNTEQDYHESRK